MTEELFWKYMQCGGGESLGDPKTPEHVEQIGQNQVVRYRDFQRGSIYWAPETGATVVDEKILSYWRSMGDQARTLGYPTSDPIRDRDRVYNRFQRGTIYYFPFLGVCEARFDRSSSRDIWRKISLITAGGLWIIVALIIITSNSRGGFGQGILAVVSLLLSPLTVLVIDLLWKQSNTNDRF